MRDPDESEDALDYAEEIETDDESDPFQMDPERELDFG